MKRLFAILLALSMLLALAACGGDSGPADPNCGVYVGDTVEAYGITMSAKDVLGDDFSIDLQAGGKAVLHYDGDTQKLKWTLNGTAFHAEGGGESLDGTLADGVLTIPDFAGSGMKVTFVNSAFVAPAAAAVTEPEPEAEAAAEPVAEPVSDPVAEPVDEPAAPAPAEAKPIGDPAPFEEITVVDNDECLVKITGIDPDDDWGYTLKVFVENRSDEFTYTFTVDNGAVNGVDWDPFFYTSVAPGKKANDEITFSNELKESLLPEFTDIELSFRVYDSDNWSAPDVADETVHVYPYGKDKATVYEREPQATDQVLFDNEYFTVIVTGFSEDDIWGYTMNLYLVNKTDTALLFSISDASVNGFMCDPYWATAVGGGNVSFASASWSDSEFEKNGITQVDEIEMTFKVFDYVSWGDFLDFSQVVKVSP